MEIKLTEITVRDIADGYLVTICSVGGALIISGTSFIIIAKKKKR